MTGFEPGRAVNLSPLVRRVTAPNGGLMTGPGTNCYLVGRDEVAVIDVGCRAPAHLEALVAAGAGRIRWILLTHSHPDHAPGARELAAVTRAPVLAYGPAGPGLYPYVHPDRRLREGERIRGSDFTLRCLHTPGHARDHLCFFLEEEALLFSGDHVMQGSTVVIAPPDGDMAAYLVTLARLQGEPIRAIAPGHGAVITDAQAELAQIVAHRMARERQILDALAAAGPLTIAALVARLYAQVPAALHTWAAMSVHAHLLKLRAEGRVAGRARSARWRLARAD